jgi:hypothetical protein
VYTATTLDSLPRVAVFTAPRTDCQHLEHVQYRARHPRPPGNNRGRSRTKAATPSDIVPPPQHAPAYATVRGGGVKSRLPASSRIWMEFPHFGAQRANLGADKAVALFLHHLHRPRPPCRRCCRQEERSLPADPVGPGCPADERLCGLDHLTTRSRPGSCTGQTARLSCPHALGGSRFPVSGRP